MMKIAYLLIIGSLFFIPLLLEPADACQYVPSDNTLQEDYEEHDFVFSGKILKVGEGSIYIPVEIEVLESWKGQPGTNILLFPCKGASVGGLEFEEGKSYLIFGENLRSEYPVVTDFGPTKLLSKAKDEIMFLDQKSNITRFHYDNPSKNNYRFIDFSYTYKIGEPVTFVLEKTAKDACNSYTATITDENGDTIWTQDRASFCIIAEDSPLLTSQIKLGFDPDNPIIIPESGNYLLSVKIDGTSIKEEFVVRQNHTGISLDRTTYPVPWAIQSPLKQIQSGIPLKEIQCRESFVLMAKNEKPACVTQPTAPKLSDKGWSWILEIVDWKEKTQISQTDMSK